MADRKFPSTARGTSIFRREQGHSSGGRARAISSRASSADFPVATDCAETALSPVLSSSVSDPWKPAPRCRNVRSIALPSWDPDRKSATGRATRELELRVRPRRLAGLMLPSFITIAYCHYHPSIIIWTGRTVVILGMRRQGKTSQRWSKKRSAKIKRGMRRLRISAISYLNTAPLMWDFEHSDTGREFDISYTLPSACARALKAGTADVGIIPAAAYAQIPGLAVLPGVAIASRQPVRSILLVSRVPLDKVRSVALDSSSMTSVALLKILFEKWLGGGRTFTPMAPDIESMLAAQDAGLLIGDPALQINRSRYFTLDLAEEWIHRTGKPFVFAFWAVRREAVRESAPSLDLASVFQQSRDHGLETAGLDQITRDWAPRLGLKESDVRSYLSESIYYYLDAPCLEGLQLFYRYAAELGVLPPAPEIDFLGAAEACIA